MTKPKRIVLDCDGVLANFREGALHKFSRTEASLTPDEDAAWEMATYLTGGDVALWWAKIHESASGQGNGQMFWALLPDFPWRRKLVDACKAVAPTTILTSLAPKPYTEPCRRGKAGWLKLHAGGVPFDFTSGPKDKAKHATPDTLLIDDYPKNTKLWTEAGGVAWTFAGDPVRPHGYAADGVNPRTVDEVLEELKQWT